MLSTLMEILACPVDHGELKLEISEQDGDDIVGGTLTCSVCGEVYPIERSIPNLLPPELRT
ncbi:MAG: methytransferase partner Trm112 [Chloroflexi bacterium]|nr:methytransferase partner Trm112 [Chloroflexota bacterium]